MESTTMAVLTCVATSCDSALFGQTELLILVQDYLLPLVELGPVFAVRVGGDRLLSLWLDAAAHHGAGLEEYTGAAMFEAIKKHGASFLERAVKTNKVGDHIWTSVANFAVKTQNREVLELLHNSNIPSLSAPHAMDIAAAMGDLELLLWIREVEFGGCTTATEAALPRAAGKGYEAVMQWLLTTETVPNPDWAVRRAMGSAAMYGQLSALQWLNETTQVAWPGYGVGAALVHGQYETAQWMYDRHLARILPSDKEHARQVAATPLTLEMNPAIGEAFARGDLQLLDWLRERDLLHLSSKLVERAKRAGHVHVLAYLETQLPIESAPYMYFTPPCAASGSIALAEWSLQRRKLSTSAAVIQVAAKHGHLELMQWFVKTVGSDIVPNPDISAVRVAAGNGHLDCVRFLVENDYATIGSDALDVAAANGHLEVIQFIASRRDMRDAANVMSAAAANGQLDVLKWLHANVKRCAATTITHAAHSGHLEVVQWLHKTVRRRNVNAATLEAVEQGHLRVVQYLVSNHTVPNAKKLVDLAHRCGHTRVAKWLDAHCNSAE